FTMNLTGKIEQYLPQHLLELVAAISGLAEQLGYQAYLVGGVVRDLLLGYPNYDLDMVVEGNALRLAQQIMLSPLLKQQIGKLVLHPRFGTAKLKCNDFTIDIATARGEVYAKPGALPVVTPGILINDLFRRDFSINAMAISLVSSNYGELIDPYHGENDLELHLIRILHPESFIDDATRILRAIRYEQRLGFSLERETDRLLKESVPMLDTISSDRIRHELELILRERYPEYAIKRLGEVGVLTRISPSLKGNGWIAEKFDQARLLTKPSQLLSLYFCLLFYPLNEKEIEQLISHLNIPGKLTRAMRDTIRLKTELTSLDKSSIKSSEIYYLLHEFEPLAIQVNAIASESLLICDYLQLFLKKLRYVKTLLNGGELKRLGISPGPELGMILETLHKAKLDGEVDTSEDEEKLALLLKRSCST
ncbi:MAG: CCA tRNA nucleotidyltransferase, partial [Chloroflexota bacterium]|nr:CCA tRNA nucleotidyltransferase [Chloroflexota bacterium]